jgi:hypothetical protein
MRRLPNHRSEKATSYEFALANRERVKGSPSERRHTTTTFAITIRVLVGTSRAIPSVSLSASTHMTTLRAGPF